MRYFLGRALVFLAMVHAIGWSGPGFAADPEGVRAMVLEVPAEQFRKSLNSSEAGATPARFLGMNGTGSVWEAADGPIRKLVHASVIHPEAMGLEEFAAQSPSSIGYVGGYDRVPPPPGTPAGMPWFQPRIESVENGLRGSLSARKDGDQWMIFLDLRDQKLIAVETMAITETASGSPPPAQSVADRLLDASSGNVRTINVTLQVPLLHRSEVAGSWRIGSRRALVVGLGAYRVQPRSSRGSVQSMERVLVVMPETLIDVEKECEVRDLLAEQESTGRKTSLVVGMTLLIATVLGLGLLVRAVLRRTGPAPVPQSRWARSAAKAG